jgi:hypothetical protein
MYLAYCKDIPIDTTISNISFSSSKSQFINHILMLENSKKGDDWLVIYGTSLLFHKSWLYCINEVTPNIFVKRFISLEHDAYICRIMDNNHTDLESEDKINFKEIELVHTYDKNELEEYASKGIKTFFLEFSIGLHYKVVCKECKKEFYKFCCKNTKIHNYLCPKCQKNKLKKCNVCYNEFLFNSNNLIELYNKEIYCCDDCLSSITSCGDCNKTLLINDSKRIEEKYYCTECYSKITSLKKCVCCNNEFFDNKNTGLIKSIKKNTQNICQPCHLYNRLNNKHNSAIHEYNYKPEPIFFGDTNSDNLFFGVELEIATNNNKEQLANYINFIVNEDEQFLYTKFDRSIGNDGNGGFEIVTHPFNYQWLKTKEGAEKIGQILNIKQFGCESFCTSFCGMHIHLSKNAFESSHLYKFLKMIYENKEFSILISERSNLEKINKYTNYNPCMSLQKLSIIKSNPHTTEDRHRAVNLSCPNTVEVRIFRGTLEYGRFMKNIEYCKSLYEFTLINSLINTNVKKYKEFIINNQRMYRNLYNFLLHKGEICV